MKENSTKKSLRASGLALLVCIVMLIGTTFAWFTDSITNTGNIIQSGNLDITATVASVDKNATEKPFWIEGMNNGDKFGFGEAMDIEAMDSQGENINKIINETLWEPGKSNAKLLEVANKGSLAAKIKLDFNIKDSGLQNALWFDFLKVENNKVTGTFTKRDMSTLKSFAGKIEIPLKAGEKVQFILVYGMKEEADNKYQGKTFNADVTILAKQDTVEADGFGNSEYDKDSKYDVVTITNEEELKDTIENLKAGDKASLNMEADIDITKEITIPSGTDVILNLKGNELKYKTETNSGSNTINNNGNLTVIGGRISSSDRQKNTSSGQSNAAIYSTQGNLEIIECELSNLSGNGFGSYCVCVNGGTAVIKDSFIDGYRGGIQIGHSANVKAINSTIQGGIYYPVYMFGSSSATFEQCRINKVPVKPPAVNAGNAGIVFDNRTSGKLVFNECDFTSTWKDGAEVPFEATKNNKNIECNNCNYSENITIIPTR